MKPSLEGIFKFVILISDPSPRCANAQKPNRPLTWLIIRGDKSRVISFVVHWTVYKYLNSPQKRYTYDTYY
jgi:hypothetical protein